MRICVDCGRKAGEIPLLSLPQAVSPDLGICLNCKDKLKRRSVTKQGTSNEADRILAEGHRGAFVPYLPQAMCMRGCGTPVLYNAMGHQQLWCSACERERMQIATGVR